MHDSHEKTEARVRTALEMRLAHACGLVANPVRCRYLPAGSRWLCRTGSPAHTCPSTQGHRGERPGPQPGSEFRGKYRRNGPGPGSRR